MNDELRISEIPTRKMILVIFAVTGSIIFGFLLSLAFGYFIDAILGLTFIDTVIWFFIISGISFGLGLLSMWLIGKKWGISWRVRIAGYIGFLIGIFFLIGSLLLTSTNQPSPLTKYNSRRISTVKSYQLALELYFDDHKSYPKTLSELIPVYFPVLLVDPVTNIPYFYSFHVSDLGKVDGYHMGADFDDRSPRVFDLDKDCNSISGLGCNFQSGYDQNSAFNGSDNQGCMGEKEKYCYDVSETD